MTDPPNTILLRLEGPLQAWGDNSKFVVRQTMDAPTKSGVVGLLCCATGLSRDAARDRLPQLNSLTMGVRLDRPGHRWWDWHTVGAGIGLQKAEGGIKRTASTKELETLVTRREYLCDASFLVALQGEPALIDELRQALADPVWPVFLGRKCCPPSRPVIEPCEPTTYRSVEEALQAIPWRPRYGDDPEPKEIVALLEWRPTEAEPVAPESAEVWYDRPVSFEPPVHEARVVLRRAVTVPVGEATQRHTRAPARPRADYQNSAYRRARAARIDADHGLCVFCKQPATTVQHVTYRNAGGNEGHDDLRALCRLCHDAVTMLEYGLGMGLDRIDPSEPRWRDAIIDKRDGILRGRSVEGRRRALRTAPAPVRKELLEGTEG